MKLELWRMRIEITLKWHKEEWKLTLIKTALVSFMHFFPFGIGLYVISSYKLCWVCTIKWKHSYNVWFRNFDYIMTSSYIIDFGITYDESLCLQACKLANVTSKLNHWMCFIENCYYFIKLYPVVVVCNSWFNILK